MSEVTFPDEVDIVETFPRDGLQRHSEFVPTDTKVEIIEKLVKAGVSDIEVTSFTHPKMIPNLKDAESVFEQINRKSGVTYRALVPNDIGMERAIDADVDRVNALITASPEYNRRNQSMTTDEILEQITEIVSMGDNHDVPVDVGIGHAFFSPFEGETPPEKTLSIVESLRQEGIENISLAATNGMAHPAQVRDLISEINDRWTDINLGMHSHNTGGMSLANTVVAMQLGVQRFDSSLCGLGGGVVFPDHLEGIGNVPSEDLVQMLDAMGISTGINFEEFTALAREVAQRLDLPPNSHVLKGGTRKDLIAAHSEEEDN